MASRFRWTLTNLGDSTSEVLTKDPIGWDEMTLRFTRDKLYHGVFTEVSTSLRWHCSGGGKEFIDNVYNTEDINGIIQVYIEIDCDGSGTYTELYTGRLDLATYSTDGEITTASIERSDLYSKLRARDEISVDLESTTSIGEETITAVTPTDLTLHSQLIFLKSAMEGSVPFSGTSTTFEVADSITIRGFVSHNLTTTSSEAENFTGWNDFSDIALNGPAASDTFIPEIFEATDDDVSYPDTYTYRLHFAGTFRDILVTGETRTNAVHSLILRYGADHATATAVTLWTSGFHTYSSATHTHAFDTTALVGTITLNYGDKVWLEWFISEVISTGPYLDDIIFEWDYDTANFSIEINSFTDPTNCKTVLVHEAFNQVCDSIADTNYSFYSDFYGRTDSDKITYDADGCGSKIAITNGLNIRAFENKEIFCSLRDLFNSFNCIHNIGLTIEEYDSAYGPLQDVIRVEQLSYFYDNTTQILNLSGGVKVDRINDNSRYINKPVIGYDRWETEYMGGLDEPCTKHEYSTKINAVKGEYNKLSKYIASGYAIESTRRKSIEESTDWRYDNDNFVIAIKSCFSGTALIGGIGIINLYDAQENALTYNPGFQIGDTIIITGTTSNNGTYTINSVNEEGRQLVVNESVTGEPITFIKICDNNRNIYSPELYIDSFTGGVGMVALDTAYNLRLTPARMLLAHMNIITSCIQIVQGLISFIKGEGNTALTTTKNDVGCQEDYNEGIQYVSASLIESKSFDWDDPNVKNITPLWIPEIYKFNYPLTAAQLATVRGNPNGYIQVTDDHSNILKGFILDAEYSLKTGLTKFELLKMYE